MRAVIICSGDWPGIAPLNERLPAPLLPLLDRPFLQHLIEFLATQGVRHWDIVLSHLPEKIEHVLGDGQRWGCSFTFHLAKDPARPYVRLRTMSWDTAATEPILLGHADRLLRLNLAELRGTDAPASALFVWRRPDDGASAASLDWTGWALLSVAQLTSIPPDADEAAVKAHLLDLPPHELRRVEIGRPLSVERFDEVLAAHTAVLHKEWDGLLRTAHEADPDIWLSRNVVLHPTAKLFPPVYIGENCEIGEGVKLGPAAVVGHGCVLDAHSTVTNSVIFPGSYVGEALELADVIVDKNRLVNVRMGAVVTITENVILGNLQEKHVRLWLLRQLGRSIGIVLLLACLPLLLGVALWLRLFRPGPVLYRKEVLLLPAPSDEGGWRTFHQWSFAPFDADAAPALASPRGLALRFLPALVNIANGELSFAGVPPRSRAEVKELPRDWQAIYLAGKPGIVTEAAVVCAADPSEDERFATETVYVASAGWKHDLKLLIGYAYRAVFGFGVHMDVEEPVPTEIEPR